MTVGEIKAKIPEAEVYELRPDCRYMLVVNKTEVSRASVEGLLRGIPNSMVLRVYNPDEAIRILELKDGQQG